jgi:hypothetical protein
MCFVRVFHVVRGKNFPSAAAEIFLQGIKAFVENKTN